MGQVMVPATRNDWRKLKARSSTTNTSKRNAIRSIGYNSTPGGRNSIAVSVARNNREGAAISACKGRSAVNAVHLGNSPAGLRPAICPTEDKILRDPFISSQISESYMPLPCTTTENVL